MFLNPLLQVAQLAGRPVGDYSIALSLFRSKRVETLDIEHLVVFAISLVGLNHQYPFWRVYFIVSPGFASDESVNDAVGHSGFSDSSGPVEADLRLTGNKTGEEPIDFHFLAMSFVRVEGEILRFEQVGENPLAMHVFEVFQRKSPALGHVSQAQISVEGIFFPDFLHFCIQQLHIQPSPNTAFLYPNAQLLPFFVHVFDGRKPVEGEGG